MEAIDLEPCLPVDLLDWLADHGRVEERPAGNVVFERGSVGDEMYVVEDGRIEITFGNALPIKSLGPGTFFGELALLIGGKMRTATVSAREDSRLRVLDRACFDQLKREHPLRFAELLELTCRYLVHSEQGLIGELERRNHQLRQALESLQRARIDLDSAELSAMTDELTGLYNRRCLNRQIEQLCEQEAPASPVTLLLADIDHFKKVNDDHGHAVGDRVLCRLAESMRQQLRWTDLPVRIGGDEFAVLLTDVTPTIARERAVQMFHSIGDFELELDNGESLRVTVSMGGAVSRLAEEAWQDLFDRVDGYLYAAKQAGRARVSWDGEVVSQLPNI